MFGLVPVRGLFGQFSGTLTVDDAGPRGALIIEAATLDTHNAKRDEHLKSADFFDVQAHPTLSFELTGAKHGPDGVPIVSGVLCIRDNALAITAPVTADNDGPTRVTLTTALDVDRTAAGIGWSKMGMIKGRAHLGAKLALTKDETSSPTTPRGTPETVA